MKITILSTILFLSSLFALAEAIITLGPFPTIVQLGKNYTLTWTATANYSYTIWLIRDNDDNPYSWDKVSDLALGVYFRDLNGSYIWNVPSNLNTTYAYALSLNGATIPSASSVFTNRTAFFAVSASNIPSSSTSASTSPTTSRSPGQTSGVVSSTPTAAVPSSTPQQSLSSGAIAGIVIGCILALAIAAGAYFVFLWHRKRSAFQQREAAARASRLAPVMEANSPSYEMHGRTTQDVKQPGV